MIILYSQIAMLQNITAILQFIFLTAKRIDTDVQLPSSSRLSLKGISEDVEGFGHQSVYSRI